MTQSLADEIRADTKRIVADFLAKGERYRGADWCGVRPADVTRAAQIMQAQSDQIAHCTCGASHAALLFEPKDRPDEGRYAVKLFSEIAACLADEKRLMGEGLVTTAGQRECL